jgi:hypothetical protein
VEPQRRGLSHKRHPKATLRDNIALDLICPAGDRAGERTQEIEHRAAEWLTREHGEFLACNARDSGHEGADPLPQHRRRQLDDRQQDSQPVSSS